MKKALLAAILVAGIAAAPAHADDALYRAFGEKEGIERLVADFTARALDDPRISHTWGESDMDRFKEKLTLQLCAITGGPCVYDGLSMAESHAPLDLKNAHFNAMVEVFQDAMDAQGIPFRTQNKLLKHLAPMQRDIVTK